MVRPSCVDAQRLPVRQAMLLLVAGVLLAFAVGTAKAHEPDYEGEGPPWPQQKTTPYPPAVGTLPFPGIPVGNIVGPVYTDIQNDPCWNAWAVDGTPPLLAGDNYHVAHIQKVTNLRGAAGAGGPPAGEPGTADLWHMGMGNDDVGGGAGRDYDLYENQDGLADSSTVMLGRDGYVRFQLREVMPNDEGPDFHIDDVHPMAAYCMYGAVELDGPYMFIDSTWMDNPTLPPNPGPPSEASIDYDLDTWYQDIFELNYGMDTKAFATYMLFIASDYNDPVQVFPPPLAIDAGGPYEVWKGTAAKPIGKVTGGVPPYKCKWTGASGTWSFVNLCGPKGGGKPSVTYQVCGVKAIKVTVTDVQGSQASDDAEVHNYCKPEGQLIVSDFPRNCLDSTVDFNGPNAKDPDGASATGGLGTGLLSQEWTWTEVASGTVLRTFSGADPPRILFQQATPIKVETTLKDGDILQGTSTYTRTFTPLGDPGCPPILEPKGNVRLPLGSKVLLDFDATDLNDPDGEGHLYTLTGLDGATFDELTGKLSFTPERVVTICGIKVRVTDQEFLWDSQEFCITVYNPTLDSDGDGAADSADNCPTAVNHDQADTDVDGVGDACDPTPTVESHDDGAGGGGGGGVGTAGTGDGGDAPDPDGGQPGADGTDGADGGTGQASDADGDGISDLADNCVTEANASQANLDGDAWGDACDADDDGDLVVEVSVSQPDSDSRVDNCIRLANPDQADADDDGIGDACEGFASAGAEAGYASAPPSDLSACGDDCPVKARDSQPTSVMERLGRNGFVGAGFGLVALLAVAGLLTMWSLKRWKKDGKA